jgi:hypothetical protein
MGIRGRTYFLGAQKDRYLRRRDVDGMRQKGERLKKLVRLLPNEGKGASIWRRLFARTVAVRAPKVAKQCWTHSSPLGSKGLLRCRNPNLCDLELSTHAHIFVYYRNRTARASSQNCKGGSKS